MKTKPELLFLWIKIYESITTHTSSHSYSEEKPTVSELQMSGFKSWLTTYYLCNLGQVTSSFRISISLSHRVVAKTNWDTTHKSYSVNWNMLHRCWLSLLAGLTQWNPNYYLRKWPICIATWIFTVIDFDWDSNALTAGWFHSLKIQLV